jgi:hypothetical protein
MVCMIMQQDARNLICQTKLNFVPNGTDLKALSKSVFGFAVCWILSQCSNDLEFVSNGTKLIWVGPRPFNWVSVWAWLFAGHERCLLLDILDYEFGYSVILYISIRATNIQRSLFCIFFPLLPFQNLLILYSYQDFLYFVLLKNIFNK